MRTVTIEIDQTTGEMSVDMAGFVGRSCQEVERLLNEALGLPDQKNPKPEFYEHVNTQQRVGGKQ